jgi:hypothetical protein
LERRSGRALTSHRPATATIGEEINPTRIFVEARHEFEVFPAGFLEGLFAPLGNFLERFQTVGNEGGTNDEHLLDSLVPEALDGHIRLRRQPRIASEPRLEGEHGFFLRKTEPLDKPVEPEVVEEAVLLDEDGNPVERPTRSRSRRKPVKADGDAAADEGDDESSDEDENDDETTADGTRPKRRRRGRRGGARRRAGVAGEEGAAPSDSEHERAEGSGDREEAVAAPAASAEGVEGEGPARPKRRRSRGGRGRSRSGSGAGNGEGGGNREGANGRAAAPGGDSARSEAASKPRAPRSDRPAAPAAPAPEAPKAEPKPKAPAKKKGLLGRILGKDA